jgi:hypothetical protein
MSMVEIPQSKSYEAKIEIFITKTRTKKTRKNYKKSLPSLTLSYLLPLMQGEAGMGYNYGLKAFYILT